MKLRWAVLCRNTITNQETHNVSLIEVIEQINFTLLAGANADDYDSFPIQFFLVALWRRTKLEESETATMRVVIQTPNGSTIENSNSTPELMIDLEKSITFRAVVQFTAFPYTEGGEYQIILQLKQASETGWTTYDTVPLLLYEGLTE